MENTAGSQLQIDSYKLTGSKGNVLPLIFWGGGEGVVCVFISPSRFCFISFSLPTLYTWFLISSSLCVFLILFLCTLALCLSSPLMGLTPLEVISFQITSKG